MSKPSVSPRPARFKTDLHGGAYLFSFPALFRDFTWRIADAASARVLCIDYRLAPEHPFPAAIEDATAAYRGLIAECAEPSHVAFIGDSSGGGLVLASMMRLRDEGSPLPAAAVVLSPWTDLALTGQSLTEYGCSDPMVPVELMPRAVEVLSRRRQSALALRLSALRRSGRPAADSHLCRW